MDTITTSIIALAIAVVGNAGAVWYKLGQLEGKVDALIRANGCKEENDGS